MCILPSQFISSAGHLGLAAVHVITSSAANSINALASRCACNNFHGVAQPATLCVYVVQSRTAVLVLHFYAYPRVAHLEDDPHARW